MPSINITQAEATKLTQREMPIFIFAHGDYYIKFYILSEHYTLIQQTIQTKQREEIFYILSSGIENSQARAWLKERLLLEQEEEEKARKRAAEIEITDNPTTTYGKAQ